jgi:hypothetical protein
MAARIGRIDLRTALKNAELAFSIRCQRSATWMAQGNAFEAASLLLHVRLDQTLMDYDYDYFPRGRVNWRKEDDRWLLVLDRKLSRAPYVTHIVNAWKIPRSRLLILTDAHYRSIARVGPPQ